MGKRHTRIVCIGIIASILITSLIITTTIEKQYGESNDRQTVIAETYTVHDPIRIVGDGNFTQQASEEGWDGIGSSVDPYKIQGYEIESYYSCIEIIDTTVHFTILDCYLLSISQGGDGIRLHNVSNAQVDSCGIENRYVGVRVIESRNVTLVNNTIFMGYKAMKIFQSNGTEIRNNTLSTDTGIWLAESADCNILLNTFDHCGLSITGNHEVYWRHNVTENSVNNQPILYLYGISGFSMNISTYGQVILGNISDAYLYQGFFGFSELCIQLGFSSRVGIVDCDIHNSTNGIAVNSSFYCNITNSLFYGNNVDITIMDSQYIDILNCDIYDNRNIAIFLDNSSACGLFDSYVGHGWTGFLSFYSDNLTISQNEIIGNLHGIELIGSQFSTLSSNIIMHQESSGVWGYNLTFTNIIDNVFSNNVGYGVYLFFGTNNWIYYNKFGGNSQSNAYDSGKGNVWDDGVSSGNYWDDWDLEGEYEIMGPAGSVDRYPQYYETPVTTTATTITTTTTTTTDETTTSITITYTLSTDTTTTSSTTTESPVFGLAEIGFSIGIVIEILIICWILDYRRKQA